MRRFIIFFLLIFLIISFTVTANAQKIILDIVSKNEADLEFIDKNDTIIPIELNSFTIYALTDKYNNIVAITTNNTITLEKLNLGYSLSVLYSNEKNVRTVIEISKKQESKNISSDKGKWRVSKETNPLDGSITLFFQLTSDEGKSVYGKPIFLTIRYKSKKDELYIGWDDYLGSEADVIYRIGKEDAIRTRWSLSTDKKGTFFHGDVIKLIRKLFEANRFVAQVTPYNESPITAIFDIRGLKNAVEPFNNILHWIE